jgi:hypothetical protein
VINIVDTPGTNVILERQQRLTEEFVPRADLILFVISADRPFTESEVTFLKYIAKWDKKVVYLLNKADILQPDEIAEVATFVQVRSFERGRVGNYNCFPSALPGLHRIRRNNFTGQLGARDGRRRGDRAARVRTRRTACQAARGGGTWCPSLKPLAVSPSLCLSLCLSRCVSLTVSLTVSPSLCLSLCLSRCVSLTVALTVVSPTVALTMVSPSLCLAHCVSLSPPGTGGQGARSVSARRRHGGGGTGGGAAGSRRAVERQRVRGRPGPLQVMYRPARSLPL